MAWSPPAHGSSVLLLSQSLGPPDPLPLWRPALGGGRGGLASVSAGPGASGPPDLRDLRASAFRALCSPLWNAFCLETGPSQLTI